MEQSREQDDYDPQQETRRVIRRVTTEEYFFDEGPDPRAHSPVKANPLGEVPPRQRTEERVTKRDIGYCDDDDPRVPCVPRSSRRR
jgi:hypothetical protein